MKLQFEMFVNCKFSLLGTTDCKQPLCDWPAATADEIDWIVKESANYLEYKLKHYHTHA